MEPLEKATLSLKIINERKATDPILFDVGELTSYTDFFILASGDSSRQVQAISKHLTKSLSKMGIKHYGIEGEEEGHWILMDYDDVIIHIFYQPVREYYDLEGLWVDASIIETAETA